MKKIIVLIVVVSLLIPAGIALANNNPAARQPDLTNIREQIQNRVEQSPEIREKIRDRVEFVAANKKRNEEIRTTNQTFVQLKKENNDLVKQIRQALIQARKENTLDEEALVNLMKSINEVASEKENLMGTLGEVRDQWKGFKETRGRDDFDGAIERLDKVKLIQQSRIDILKEINKDLNEILNELQPETTEE